MTKYSLKQINLKKRKEAALWKTDQAPETGVAEIQPINQDCRSLSQPTFLLKCEIFRSKAAVALQKADRKGATELLSTLSRRISVADQLKITMRSLVKDCGKNSWRNAEAL
jgi:hypothetical protein